MNELKKHTLLLTILSLLLCLKFIFVPIFEWQNELIEEINQLDKRLLKAEKVIASKDLYNRSNLILKEEIAKGDNVLFPNQKETLFKLERQKDLESILDKHSIKLNNIGWQTPRDIETIGAKQYFLQMSFSGKTLNVVNLLMSLEAMNKLISVQDFNITVKNQTDDDLGSSSGRLVLSFFLNTAPNNSNEVEGV